MSIALPVISVTPQPTSAARKAAKLTSLQQRLTWQAGRGLTQYDQANRAGIDLINSDPDFKPSEGWAALGTNAVSFLQGSEAAAIHIAQMYALAGVAYTPPALPLGVTVTPNSDGTVTATP